MNVWPTERPDVHKYTGLLLLHAHKRKTYTVCLKKTVQNYFCQNFVKFSPTTNSFLRKDGKDDKLITRPDSVH